MNEQDEAAIKQIEQIAEDAKKIAHDAITRYVYLTVTASMMRKLGDPKAVAAAAVLDLDALTQSVKQKTDNAIVDLPDDVH